MSRPLLVLVVDEKDQCAQILERQTQLRSPGKFKVSLLRKDSFFEEISKRSEIPDMVLIGESVGDRGAGKISRTLRAFGWEIPIAKLTLQSEAKVPRSLANAGVNVMLNLADLKSPVFSWTLGSILSKESKSKPGNHNGTGLRDRMQLAAEELISITYLLNNTLSSLRLAAHRLNQSALDPLNAQKIGLLLEEKLGIVSSGIKQLEEIGHTLGDVEPPFSIAPERHSPE